MKLSISRLRSHTTWIAFFAAAFVVACPYLSTKAGSVDSGQRMASSVLVDSRSRAGYWTMLTCIDRSFLDKT